MMKEEVIKSTVGEIRDSVNRTHKALPSTPVRSLADIIKFNEDNPDLQAGLGKHDIGVPSNARKLTVIRPNLSHPSARG